MPMEPNISAASSHNAITKIEPVSLLRQLVRIPSYETTAECQSLVKKLMLEIGLEILTFSSSSPISSDLVNVVGRLKGKTPSIARSLIIAAHVDTVPPDPLNRWNYDPFAGVIFDGKMYGRGACDDKAGIALMLALAERLKNHEQLDGDVYFASMADDESSGDGFRKLSELGIVADGCLMLDGAKIHQIGFAHAGCLWFSMEVRGTTTACNNKAFNAIEKSITILNALLELAAQFNQNIEGAYAAYTRPVRLNICKMQGGEWLGNNAASCVTEFSLNFIPPENVASVKAAIQETVERIVDQDEWLSIHPPRLEPIYMAFDPYESPLDSAFYKAIECAHRDVTGITLEPRAITGWFHGPAFDCPCFLYGPGNGGAAHGADEYFEIGSFEQLLPPLEEIAQRWCKSLSNAANADGMPTPC